MEARKHPERFVPHFVALPFMWANLITIVAADIIGELYHRIAFPLYGLPYVDRKKYIRIDRHRLKYLSLTEKIGCAYCGYANGWIHYAAAIAANTEQYWCGIKHQKRTGTYEQPHHKGFVEFGDEEGFRERYST